MDSRKRFSALETMCRERAQLAKREFEYWLAEADEWARYKDSSDPSIDAIPTQFDWCAEPPGIIKTSARAGSIRVGGHSVGSAPRR